MSIVAKSVIAARAAAAAALATTPVVQPAIEVRARTRVLPAVAPATPPAAPPGVTPEPERDNYEVGYKKPPKHSQFKPGESGNRKGRPKGAKGLKTIVREVLTEKVAVRTPAGVRKMSKMEVIVRKKAEIAITGNLRAIDGSEINYQHAVPDEVAIATGTGSGSQLAPEQFDAVDQATWEALVAMLGAPMGQGQ